MIDLDVVCGSTRSPSYLVSRHLKSLGSRHLKSLVCLVDPLSSHYAGPSQEQLGLAWAHGIREGPFASVHPRYGSTSMSAFRGFECYQWRVLRWSGAVASAQVAGVLLDACCVFIAKIRVGQIVHSTMGFGICVIFHGKPAHAARIRCACLLFAL